MGLDDVLAEAALQTRVDRKYLLTPDQFQELAQRVGGTFSVLDIDGQRIFGYESVYFDTEALDLFRPDLFMLNPLGEIHDADENDNPAQRRVAPAGDGGRGCGGRWRDSSSCCLSTRY